MEHINMSVKLNDSNLTSQDRISLNTVCKNPLFGSTIKNRNKNKKKLPKEDDSIVKVQDSGEEGLSKSFEFEDLHSFCDNEQSDYVGYEARKHTRYQSIDNDENEQNQHTNRNK